MRVIILQWSKTNIQVEHKWSTNWSVITCLVSLLWSITLQSDGVFLFLWFMPQYSVSPGWFAVFPTRRQLKQVLSRFRTSIATSNSWTIKTSFKKIAPTNYIERWYTTLNRVFNLSKLLSLESRKTRRKNWIEGRKECEKRKYVETFVTRELQNYSKKIRSVYCKCSGEPPVTPGSTSEQWSYCSLTTLGLHVTDLSVSHSSVPGLYL